MSQIYEPEESDYFPIEYIFNFLSVCRKVGELGSRQVSIELQKRKMFYTPPLDNGETIKIPRISFWKRLCQAASLMDSGDSYRPTSFVKEWLSWPFLRQMESLLFAWVDVPKWVSKKKSERTF